MMSRMFNPHLSKAMPTTAKKTLKIATTLSRQVQSDTAMTDLRTAAKQINESAWKRSLTLL